MGTALKPDPAAEKAASPEEAAQAPEGQQPSASADVKKALGSILPGSVTPEKDELSRSDDTNQIKHGSDYSKILSAYRSHVEQTLSTKRYYKEVFFLVSMLILGLSPLLFLCALQWYLDHYTSALNLSELLPLLTALGEFLASLLVLPRIIAEYLFNDKEEESVVNIVNNMQVYDMNIRDRNDRKTGSQ